MAKEQKPKYSYAPNTGLIGGEAQVAASEAGLSNVGQSFAVGAASVFGAIKQANAERDAKMEAYETEIGGIVKTNQFEDPKNKQVIKNFLNTQKDEFIRLSKIYDKTNDREVKDKMEEIKFSLVNLNDQIKVFNQDKIDYRTASDENQLASLKTYDNTGDDFFTTAFTNNAAFSIDEMGDINFGINNNSYKYKDKAGKWESNDNIDESNLFTLFAKSYSDGGQGKAFNSGNIRRSLYNSFKNTGNNALKVFVTTDLTSDESSLSFEEQFASGELKEKHPEMYAGFTAKTNGTYDTDWMFESKNADLLRNKVSNYFTKVIEDGHGQGRTDNYKPDPVEIKGTKTTTNPYGIPKDGLKLGDPMPNGYQIEVRQDLVTGYINDIKAGGDFKFLQNDYSYVDGNWYENYGTKPNENGQSGEFKYDSTQAMTDDVFQTGGKYFDGLETKIQIDPTTGESFNETAEKSKVNPLELSALGNAKSTRDVFEKIQAAYKTKNEAIKTATGSIGGLSARKSGQSIYITIDGIEKEFSLGSAGGFGGTSVNPNKRTDYLTNLEALLNAVNGSLNPEYIKTDYNSTKTN